MWWWNQLQLLPLNVGLIIALSIFHSTCAICAYNKTRTMSETHIQIFIWFPYWIFIISKPEIEISGDIELNSTVCKSYEIWIDKYYIFSSWNVSNAKPTFVVIILVGLNLFFLSGSEQILCSATSLVCWSH